jgi:hypothetical protein
MPSPKNNDFNPAIRTRLLKLFGLLGSAHSGERDNATDAINRVLEEIGRTWNDLPGLLGTTETIVEANAFADEPWADVDDADQDEPRIPTEKLLGLVVCALREHVQLEEREYLAVALWAMHTHAFNRYAVTPRLALVSPVRGCGKTTLLGMLARLCRLGRRFDNVSPALLYRIIEAEQPTLLLDEIDTHDLGGRGMLHNVLNSGHQRDGATGRAASGQRGYIEYSTFAPVALASIGLDALPLQLQHRSIVISMRRADGQHHIRRLDDTSEAMLIVLGRHIRAWAEKASLERNPVIPPELRNRAADNWLPLIAIADACGGDWGRKAREAAIAISGEHADEDPGVVLLQDIRTIFNRFSADRLSSRDLVAALNALDDAPWSEWRGPLNNQQARALSQMQLAQLLRRFNIRPRSMWHGPRPQGQSVKSYRRYQFQEAWRSYCTPPKGGSVPNGLQVAEG